MVSLLESIVAKYSFSLPTIFSSIVLLSSTMNGLTFKLCGAIGVITKLFDAGANIGPPQLNE